MSDIDTCTKMAKVQIRRIHHNRYPVPEWVTGKGCQQVYLHPYQELMQRNHV